MIWDMMRFNMPIQCIGTITTCIVVENKRIKKNLKLKILSVIGIAILLTPINDYFFVAKYIQSGGYFRVTSIYLRIVSNFTR